MIATSTYKGGVAFIVMKKEIIQVDKIRQIFRITTLNERWYAEPHTKEVNGLPTFIFKPSTTWVAGYYPKGIPFYKWLAEHGWDEAEAIKNAAGDKGSKVHYACSDIDLGVKIDVVNAKYMNNSLEIPEALTIEEIDCINSYATFIEDFKPQVVVNEGTFFSDITGGTIDRIFIVNDKTTPGLRHIWILDIKTSKYIWREMELQISDYSHMNINYREYGITDIEWATRQLFILQVGTKTKKGYKLTEIKDSYDMFRNVAYRLWQDENKNAVPIEAEYPLFISSPLRVKEIEELKKQIKK